MLHIKNLVVFSDQHKRSENQDCAFHLAFDGNPYPKSAMSIYAVLDGVSHSNGGIAAPIAAAAMRPRLAELLGKADALLQLDDDTKRAEIWHILKCAIHDADDCLRAMPYSGNSNHGTTITLAVVFDEAVFTANIGDSPAYLLRLAGRQEGTLLPLFRCQNEAGMAVSEGKLSPEDALRSPLRNALIHMVGAGILDTDIRTSFAWLSQSDLLLLGSDGALAVLSEAELTKLVLEQDPEDVHAVAGALFRRIQESSSTDNFTVIIQKLETD